MVPTPWRRLSRKRPSEPYSSGISCLATRPRPRVIREWLWHDGALQGCDAYAEASGPELANNNPETVATGLLNELGSRPEPRSRSPRGRTGRFRMHADQMRGPEEGFAPAPPPPASERPSTATSR